MPLTLESLKKAREAGLDDERIAASIERKDPELGKLFVKGREAGMDNGRILRSIERRLSAGKDLNVKPLYTPEKQRASYADFFKHGLRTSAAGQLGNIGDKTPEQLEKDPSFFESFIENAGHITGDIPFMLVGGTLGSALGSATAASVSANPYAAAAGGVVGGSAGAFAFPTFIKEASKEYQDYVAKGNDITFGEFLQRADRVGSETLKSGAMGVILGQVSKAIPYLEKIPGLGALFKSKIAKKAVELPTEAAILVGAPALAEGKIPSGRDYAEALAVTLGFQLAKIPTKIRERIQKQGEASKLTPEEFAKRMRLDELQQLRNDISEELAAKDQVAKVTAKEKRESKVGELELEQTRELIEDIPEKNKRTVAEKAVEKGIVKNEKDLELLLDEYEAVYPSIPGNVRDKNRKFLNKYATKKEPLKPKTEAELREDLVTQVRALREAISQGDRKAEIEARKNIKRIKRNEIAKENPKENQVRKQKPEREVNQEIETPKEKSIRDLKKQRIKEKRRAAYEARQMAQENAQDANFFAESLDRAAKLERDAEKLRRELELEENPVELDKEIKKTEKQIDSLQKQLQKGRAEGKDKYANLLNNQLEKQKAYLAKLKSNVKPLYTESVKPKSKTSSISASRKLLAAKKPKPPKRPKPQPKPIVETTGQGAEQRLQEEPTKVGKVKQLAGKAIEKVTNPRQTAHEVLTAVFDFLEPLQRLENDIPETERVSTKVKQAQVVASEINQVLEKGIFDNVSNSYDPESSLAHVYRAMGEVWAKASKGLKDQNYILKEMDVYRTAKENLKRQKRGLKSGVDTAQSEKDVARLKQKYGPIDQRLHTYQIKLANQYGKDMLGEKGIKAWTQDSHASLYRAMDWGGDSYMPQGSLSPKKWWHKAKGSERKILPPSESDALNASMLITNSRKNEAILQYKKLVEQKRMPGRVVKSKRKQAPKKFVEELELDPTNEELNDNLYDQSRKNSFITETGRLRGWENGKPFEIEVPKDIFDTFASQAPADYTNFTKFLQSAARFWSRGTTSTPLTFLSIVTRDATNSLVYSKTGANPLSIARALIDIYKDTHSWNQFKSMGGQLYAERLASRTDRIDKIEKIIKAESPNSIKIAPNKLLQFFKKHMDNISASVPFAEYQRAIKKYGDTPDGRTLALLESKKVTYDPTVKGGNRAVRTYGSISSFFNVMLQEPYMIARHIARPEFLAKGLLIYGLPALLSKFINEGNPDYEALSPVTKAAAYHFYVGDSHYWFPTAWLTGGLFKNTVELIYDIAKANGGDSWKGMYSYIASQFTGTVNPILQAITEQSTNQSFPNPAQIALLPFTQTQKRAPPVVPKYLEGLPPEEQYTERTSLLAKKYGQLTGASPVKVDRLIKTLGSTQASIVLALADEIGYQTGLVEDNRTPQGAAHFLLLSKFVADSTPKYTKYQEDFYDRLSKAKLDHQRGKPNQFEKLKRYNSQISQLFKEYKQIDASKIDPEEKRKQIKRKQQQINAKFKEAVESTK